MACETTSKLKDNEVNLIVQVVKKYIEKGTTQPSMLVRALKSKVKKATGLKLSEIDLEHIMSQPFDDKISIKEHLENIITPEQTEKELAIQRAKKLAVLNKLMPKNKKKTSSENAKDAQKILTAYENGALDGMDREYTDASGNKTRETFEDLIYEKHGIVNTNKKDFRDKIEAFAKEIKNSPENSDLRNQAYQRMYDYIQGKQKQTLVEKGMAVWYANILSSYETHLRNMKFNALTLLVNQNLLLAEKALLKGDFLQMFDVMKEMGSGLALGMTEAQRVMKGGVSRFDKPGYRTVSETAKTKLGGVFKWPGRALRAADVLFTVPLYQMKQKEMLYNQLRQSAKDNNVEISNAELKSMVNEELGHTTERVKKANETATNDIEKVYGVDWKNNKEAKARHKIRVAEIMESTRPQAIKDESLQWAKRAVLTNTPRGIYKYAAEALTAVGKMGAVGKMIVPFVNIALNITDRMVERSPMAFINVIRGKKGVGQSTEQLTPDERKELLLRAVNYTALMTVVTLATAGGDDDEENATLVVTGKNTNDYAKGKSDEEGGQFDPYSVYVKGVKVFEWKDSPFAAVFAPAGFRRDYVKYGKNEGNSEANTKMVFDFLAFATDIQATKGLKEFLEFISPKENRKLDPTSIAKSLATSSQNFFVPNILKAVNNDVRGAFGYNDYKANDWKESFFKDIPFVEQLMTSEKYDHLGRPIKDQFKIPLVPFEERQPVDKYYKLFTDKKYYPSYPSNKTIYDFKSGKEVDLDANAIEKLTKERGRFIISFLDSKTDDGKTVYEKMEAMPNDVFKDRMSYIFSEASKLAKKNLYGEKIAEDDDSETVKNEERKDFIQTIKDLSDKIK